MQEKGILMIAAAGNNGEQAGAHVQYPAAYSEVIGVGSVDENLSYSSFSAKGDQVELMAPGERIYRSRHIGIFREWDPVPVMQLHR